MSKALFLIIQNICITISQIFRKYYIYYGFWLSIVSVSLTLLYLSIFLSLYIYILVHPIICFFFFFFLLVLSCEIISSIQTTLKRIVNKSKGMEVGKISPSSMWSSEFYSATDKKWTYHWYNTSFPL